MKRLIHAVGALLLGVAIATASLERLRHALQHLLPARDSDSRTDDQGCFARTDLLDERLGDRVLVHPKSLCLL